MNASVEARSLVDKPLCGRSAVQPCGFLLGLSSDWRINCASANLDQFLGIPAEAVLGKSIASVLAGSAVHLIRNRVALLRDEDSPERLIDQPLVERGAAFDACLRLSKGMILLEAVPGTDPGGIDVAGTVERMLVRIETQASLKALAEAATRELRGLTGFDAIHIYRNGEAQQERIASFVRSGLSDFEPANVRASALQRPLWICDNDTTPVPLICTADQRQDGAPGILANPDPGLAEQIGRTGAQSAVLLPIARDGHAWGFVLALHRTTRAPRLARFSAAELFARILGLRISALQPSG